MRFAVAYRPNAGAYELHAAGCSDLGQSRYAFHSPVAGDTVADAVAGFEHANDDCFVSKVHRCTRHLTAVSQGVLH
jgi:hypothetical protein